MAKERIMEEQTKQPITGEATGGPVKTTTTTTTQTAMDAVGRSVSSNLNTLQTLMDIGSKQGFAMLFATIVLWKVLLPLAEKHGEFVDKTGNAVEKIAGSIDEISSSTMTTAEATIQNAEVIKEMQKQDGPAGVLATEHLNITKEIQRDVTEIKAATVKPHATGTRPRP